MLTKAVNLWSGLPDRLSVMSLVQQFALASFLTLLIGMATTASWVSNRIENGVVNNSALSTALYMDSFVAPLSQEIASGNQISEKSRAALSQLLDRTSLSKLVVSYKIWGKEGVVVHSSNPSLIGKQFPITDSLGTAWGGKVEAEYDSLQDEEDVIEKSLNVTLLEIYSPIRDATGKVIGVSEFYTDATELEKDLWLLSLQSWLLFGVVGLGMFAALFGVMLRASKTIDNQKDVLKKRVNESLNLRQRLQQSSRRSTELNESFLRRVGADLHDGPAQLLAFALLKLDELSSESRSPADRRAVELSIKEPLQDALTEIRNLSGGLTLPGFEGKSVRDVIEQATSSHERRTGTVVHRDFDQLNMSVDLPESILICAYRFVQEGLNNAFQHGETTLAFVCVTLSPHAFIATVYDHGVGFNHTERVLDSENPRLGLAGLRERIESVGGSFVLKSKPGEGTSIRMKFNLDANQEEKNKLE